ncbi:MAG: hypothetical protein AUH85_14005 [Chloroflexi bacterium 13_1_40CM_4_68_4]|nr:MAG: hypothetical protein AUH85_14005 [Chloroflexi bacterium 13_1_40CM_4_68_4]
MARFGPATLSQFFCGGVSITDPLVSVVLCGYNQGQYLAHAVESVLAQTYSNIELILIDNGSTDDSREIARRYASHSKVQLLLHEVGATVGKRSNEGIAASSGRFISFLWADDWYLLEKTEVQMEAFARLPSDYGVVYSPGYRHNEETGREWHDGTPEWSGWVLEPMLRDYHRAWLNMDAPLVRRECFIRFPFYEDVFLEAETIFLRIATVYRYHFVPRPLVVTRDHHSNLGKAYEYLTQWNLLLLKRLQREEAFPARLVPLLDRVRATSMRNLGWKMIRLAGERSKGRACLEASLEWGALNVFHPRFVAGMAMSVLPLPLLGQANRLANRIRRHRENIEFVTDIGEGGRLRIPQE